MARKSNGYLSIKGRLDVENATTPGTWVRVAQVRSLSGPTYSADQVEVTTFDSDEREYIPGLGGSGTITLGLVYDGPAMMQLRGLKGAERNYRVVYPDNATMLVPGFVSALSTEMSAPEAAITMSATITLTGEIVATPPGPSITPPTP